MDKDPLPNTPNPHCNNCHGVQDMNLVFRRFLETTPDWCPFCCGDRLLDEKVTA